MRVLLINPAWPSGKAGGRRYRRAWPPLDLLIAAAALRNSGHEPELLDQRADPVLRDMSAAARRADLVLVQTTPMDRWQCPDLNWEYLSRLAAELPREKLIVAGAHGTVWPELILRETGARAVVRGDPTKALVELADKVGNPRGISYYRDQVIINEPDRGGVNLDQLPAPAYDLVSPDYYGYDLLGPGLAVLETSRGCPYNCIFCFKAMYGPGRRVKSLDQVVRDVEMVVAQWGARNLYFIDLEFTLDRDYTVRLCRELVKLNLKFHWCCQTRVDAVDDDLLREMKNAGCTLIHFGVETGAPRLLEAINKGLTLDQVYGAMDGCRRAGIKTACFFLFGLPGETDADRRATMTLARKANPDFASFHVAAPYPGTKFGEMAQRPEPFPPCAGDSHHFRMLVTVGRRAWLGFYLRPAYLTARLREGHWWEQIKRLKLFWEFVK
jgi:radical SAM superfamily enzyme YgiQ (UPF0313 family)